MILQAQLQQQPDSIEEGECSQPPSSTPPADECSPNGKTDLQESPSASRNLTPKSARSSHSQNADSGRASGKAAELDDMQQAEEEAASYAMTDVGTAAKRSEEIYALAKEIVAQESDFRRALNDAEKQKNVLEARITSLRKTLAGCVSREAHEELRQKYLEVNMKLRAVFESKFEDENVDSLKGKAMSELRNEVILLHKQLSQLASEKWHMGSYKVEEELKPEVDLKAEMERLKKAAEIAHEEALVHREIDSAVLAEFNDLRRRIAQFEAGDSQALTEAANLSFELANRKVVEIELREKNRLLEREVAEIQEKLIPKTQDFEIEGLKDQNQNIAVEKGYFT